MLLYTHQTIKCAPITGAVRAKLARGTRQPLQSRYGARACWTAVLQCNYTVSSSWVWMCIRKFIACLAIALLVLFSGCDSLPGALDGSGAGEIPQGKGRVTVVNNSSKTITRIELATPCIVSPPTLAEHKLKLRSGKQWSTNLDPGCYIVLWFWEDRSNYGGRAEIREGVHVTLNVEN